MEFQKVLPSDDSIVMFAKIAVNQGRSPGLEKDAFYDAIVKRADDLRADGESHQQAFAKAITDDETGRLLYRAMKIAPGSEVKPGSSSGQRMRKCIRKRLITSARIRGFRMRRPTLECTRMWTTRVCARR
jgi:hypothetical protein